jgi:hypothetical protein
MYQHVLNFLGVGILSGVLAAAAIAANAMRIDKDPAVDGPRALIAEFFGLWIAFACLAWSFVIEGPAELQWILRSIGGGAAILSFALAAYFAGTPEVRIRLDEEPTGFDVPITALQLHEYHAQQAETSAENSAPRDRTWSELNPQP